MPDAINPKRVLIIGGGAAGLVTLRNLVQLGQFDHIELVERRDNVGGVWYYDQPDPSNSHRPRWPSPAYPNLVGNVLPEFLSYSKAPFPTPSNHPDQPFPTLAETHQYLVDFAEPLKSHIRLNTEIIQVLELAEGGWKVTSRDYTTALPETREEIWDAVVICVCWYDNPVWPEVEGLDVLRQRDLARHAKWWRGPKGCEGKKVLVLGNANSSNDIAAQLVPVASTPVYRSIRRPAFPGFVSLPDERIKDIAPVKKYILHENNKITAILTDDTEINDLDLVEVGTGYIPRPSFVHVLDPETRIKAGPIIHDGIVPYRVPSLHRLILYAHNPTLAFIGITISYTPFPIADVSSLWLALAWRGEVSYPATAEERLITEQDRLRTIQEFRDKWGDSSLYVYSVLGATEEGYAAGLRKDIVSARPDLDEVIMHWNEERTKHRETMFSVKRKALEWTRERKKGTGEII